VRRDLSADHFATDTRQFLLSRVHRQSADSVCQLRVLLVLQHFTQQTINQSISQPTNQSHSQSHQTNSHQCHRWTAQSQWKV